MIPRLYHWKNEPAEWSLDENRLTITAGGLTNWFISPRDGAFTASGPTLLFEAAQDFIFSARVTSNLPAQWDAGMLMAYADDTTWAKLAFEKSIYQEPTVISVVTRGISDDCNSVSVEGNSVWLRLDKTGDTITFFYSLDGTGWRQVRVFTLGPVTDLQVGMGAQSPIGQGATAEFTEITYRPDKSSLG